jgi:hypothetical protein
MTENHYKVYFTLLAFFGLTFLISWAAWVPMALDHFGLWPVKMEPNVVLVVRLLGTLGPVVGWVERGSRTTYILDRGKRNPTPGGPSVVGFRWNLLRMAEFE